MKIFLVLIVLVTVLGLSFYQSQTKLDASKFVVIEPISKTALREAMRQEGALQLIDVRTALERKAGAIESSINIDYLSKDFTSQFDQFDKDQPIYLYCRSGSRSAKAARLLSQEGFSKIYDLQGGFLAWQK